MTLEEDLKELAIELEQVQEAQMHLPEHLEELDIDLQSLQEQLGLIRKYLDELIELSLDLHDCQDKPQ